MSGAEASFSTLSMKVTPAANTGEASHFCTNFPLPVLLTQTVQTCVLRIVYVGQCIVKKMLQYRMKQDTLNPTQDFNGWDDFEVAKAVTVEWNKGEKNNKPKTLRITKPLGQFLLSATAEEFLLMQTLKLNTSFLSLVFHSCFFFFKLNPLTRPHQTSECVCVRCSQASKCGEKCWRENWHLHTQAAVW